MKTRTVSIREGEWLGPIDWDAEWPFEVDEKTRKALREIEANPEDFEITTDGGWPRIGWGQVFHVGMWDGWPYWRPGPAITMRGVLGTEIVWGHYFDWQARASASAKGDG